ncbi:MAG TPA: restriction endonuclease subunit S [Daejeonella sp.]|nr:restriction endonuclease subunit S [Daejeonella sp.]
MRFPGFEGEWEEYKLEDVCSNFKAGKSITSSSIFPVGKYPVYGGNGLRGYTNKFNHEGNFVLIGRQGALCGNITYIEGKSYISEHAIVIGGTKISDVKWLNYKLFSMNLGRLSESSAQPGLSVEKLKKLKVRLPKWIEEQTKVASLLSLIDSRIQTQKKIIGQLESLITGLSKKIFSQQLKFKNDNGNDFPEWEVRKLKEVYSFRVTNSFSRDDLNYYIGKVKNIHYGDIHTKFQTLFDITKEQVPYINPNISISRIPEENYCKEGDIVFADASEDLNDVGKSMEIVNLNQEKLLSGLHTILARPISGKLYIGFGAFLFQSKKNRLQIQKESQGTKVLSISTDRLANINLQIPCINEQALITNFFSSIYEKIQAEKKILVQYENQKKYLLQNLFI